MLSIKVFGALSLCLAAYGQHPPRQAKEISAYIDSKGARTVVKELIAGDQKAWRQVITKIDMGSTEWLAVAKKLLPATDAGGTQDLHVALAIALTHNPNKVLSMTGPNLPLEQVCTIPFIEPDEKTVREHRRKVRSALGEVTSEALLAKKKECLADIAK